MRRGAVCWPCAAAAAADFGRGNRGIKKALAGAPVRQGQERETILPDYRANERICQYMSVSKFTPAELEELRRADAEIDADADGVTVDYELDAELDAIAIAQSSGKSAEQVVTKRKADRNYYQENREARLAYGRKYRAEHKEEIARKKRQWYLDHKSEYAERSRNYAKSHPENMRNNAKAYYETHVKNDPQKLEAMRIYQREYYRKNKEIVCEKAKQAYQKRKRMAAEA